MGIVEVVEKIEIGMYASSGWGWFNIFMLSMLTSF